MSSQDIERGILGALRIAEDMIKSASRAAEDAGLPFVMLPLKTMVLPILKEIIAQLDGYRNDFVADEDLKGWSRIGTYHGGRRYDEEVERPKF